MSVAVLGEALVDLVPAGGARFSARVGGSPYTTAIGLARLGVDTTLLARFGDNAFGRLLRSCAHDAGVDISAAPVVDRPTTLAVVSLDRDGSAGYDFYLEGTADWGWTDAELSAAPVADVLHFGSLASWTPPGADRIVAHAHRARAGDALVTYDPNVRPGLLGDPTRALPAVDAAVAAAHVVRASAEDVGWLYPALDHGEVAERWLRVGARLVVLTLGAGGAVAFGPGGVLASRPGRSVEVVDTVGAGDSFTAALLAGLVRRDLARPSAVVALSPADAGELLDDAVLASSITCTRAGADPPTRSDLDAVRGAPGD